MDNNNIKEQYIRYSLIAIIIIMGFVLFKQILPYMGGFLGAFTIYILVRKRMMTLTMKKKMKQSKAALLITSEIIFLFLIPLSCIVWLIINKLEASHLSADSITGPIQDAENYIKAKFGFDILGTKAVSFMTSEAPEIGKEVMGEVSSFLVNIFVLIFILYFMLIGGTSMESYIKDILPFTPDNKQHVLNKIKVIVHSNAIGIPLQAIIQAFISTIGYLIFGVPNALMLGIITGLATMIPVIGTSVIWVPIACYMALSGRWFDAAGVIVYGLLVIAQADNRSEERRVGKECVRTCRVRRAGWEISRT